MLRKPQSHHSTATPRRSRLIRYLTVAYILLVIYASLYPFDWHAAADNPIGFILAAWPRYVTIDDPLLNIAGYLPLGFMLMLTLRPTLSAPTATVVSTLAATLLSFGLEALQNFVPSRVPSNLDVLCNGLGAFAGGILAVTGGERLFLTGYLHGWRQRILFPGARTDAGFLLLLLWLFTQLNPQIWLFGNGDVGYRAVGSFVFDPESYKWIQAGVAAFNLAAICILTAQLARPGWGLRVLLPTLIGMALMLKTIADVALLKPADAALWLTPGSMLGLPAGIVLYIALSRLPQRAAAGAAALLLMSGVTLVNLAPVNPYLEASIQTWRHGKLLNFEGVTGVVAAIWPFCASVYLLWLCIFPEPPAPSGAADSDSC